MQKRFFSFSVLPFWLKVSILVTEALFVVTLGAVGIIQASDLERIEGERQGAVHALALSDSLRALSRFSAECSLAGSVAVEAAQHAESCEESRALFESTDQNHSKTYSHPVDEATLAEEHVREDQFSSYNLSITGTEQHLRGLLSDYFEVYTDSGIQLNAERSAYTTGRIVLVHLPELYAYITMARNEAVYAHNMTVSYSHLLNTQGAVHRIAEQTENTFRALLEADLSAEAQVLNARMIKLHTDISGYFDYLDSNRFSSQGRTAYQRDNYQIAVANRLLEDLLELKSQVAKRFEFHLQEQRQSTLEILALIGFSALVLQALLILLFTAIARTFGRAEASARQLAGNLQKQDKMFSIIGHELRTPAAAVKMQIDELITQGIREPKLKEISNTAEHLLDVLDDMRVGSSAAITNEFKVAGQFSVYEVCEEAVHSLYFLAGRYKINLGFNASNYAKISSYGYKKQIRQIVINLVKNAIIHAEARTVELRLQTQEEADKTAFVVQVIDDGKGIGAETKTRLFQAYERGESAASGTGLGLYVSRQLANEMEGGSLKLSDNPSGGSIFEFCFTLENYKPELDHSDAATSLIKGKRILFVEDTPTLLMLGHAILERAGAEVVDARHGKEALAQLANGEFDMVVTDIMMPEMDGYELTRELRAQGFSKPIIGVTGATVGEEAGKLLQCGANSVLPKPLKLENLNAALKAL